jgi:hypothetical protein
MRLDYSQKPNKYNHQSSEISQEKLYKSSVDNIYKYLLNLLKNCSGDEVLKEFQNLFFHYAANDDNSTVLLALSDLVLTNKQNSFIDTLKRSCYILINNWNLSKDYQCIHKLVASFDDFFTPSYHPYNKILHRLHNWLYNFVNSEDYQQLKTFADRFDNNENPHWINRFKAYLLVPQYQDLANSQEQREAALNLSKQLREKFKFDLVKYTTFSQSAILRAKTPENPTSLGDDALVLIKKILMTKGMFNHVNIGNIFVKQTRGLDYYVFKESLCKYLFFGMSDTGLLKILQQYIYPKIRNLYLEHDEEITDGSLILRTCNKVINFLTTEYQGFPTSFFVLSVSENNPLRLVLLLLKLILICPNSRNHLENAIAKLLQHYQDSPESDCEWLINFMDVFNITFTIYTENVRYNLIKVHDPLMIQYDQNHEEIDEYLIFSQINLHGQE